VDGDARDAGERGARAAGGAARRLGRGLVGSGRGEGQCGDARRRRVRVLCASLTLLPPPPQQSSRSGADPEAYHGSGNLAGGRRGPGP